MWRGFLVAGKGGDLDCREFGVRGWAVFCFVGKLGCSMIYELLKAAVFDAEYNRCVESHQSVMMPRYSKIILRV